MCKNLMLTQIHWKEIGFAIEFLNLPFSTHVQLQRLLSCASKLSNLLLGDRVRLPTFLLVHDSTMHL